MVYTGTCLFIGANYSVVYAIIIITLIMEQVVMSLLLIDIVDDPLLLLGSLETSNM